MNTGTIPVVSKQTSASSAPTAGESTQTTGKNPTPSAGGTTSGRFAASLNKLQGHGSDAPANPKSGSAAPGGGQLAGDPANPLQSVMSASELAALWAAVSQNPAASQPNLPKLLQQLETMAAASPQQFEALMKQQPGLQQWMAQAAALLGRQAAPAGTGVNGANSAATAGNGDAGLFLKLVSQLAEEVQNSSQPGVDTGKLQQLKQELANELRKLTLPKLQQSALAEQPKAGGQSNGKPPAAATLLNESGSGTAKSMLQALASRTIRDSGSFRQDQNPSRQPIPTAKLTQPDTSMAAAGWQPNASAAVIAPTAPAVPAVPIRQFSQEVAGLIMKQIEFTQSGGVTQAKITLIPEHLGQVDVQLSMQNGQLTAHFTADSLQGKEALQSQLAELKANLQSQGIQVDKLVVSQQMAGSDAQMFQGDRQPGRQMPSPSRRSQDTGYEDDGLEGFALALQGLTMPTAASAYGPSFNATA